MDDRKHDQERAPTILLVEDSRLEAELLRRTLVGGGYRVVLALDGREGLDKARTELPDLVMSDIRMPRMNGYELCQAIKHDPALAHTPVVLLSVLSEPDDIIEAINAGADSYTIKPYNEATLLGRLKSLLAAPGRRRPAAVESLEVQYRGRLQRIAADPHQMLNLLLSVYENTLLQNRELMATQAELSRLNESLEDVVRQRTADLQASEARFRATFEQAAVGIALVAPDGHWLRVNQRLCEITGYSAEEFHSLNFRDLTHPEDLQSSVQGMENILSGLADSYTGQKRYRRKNGDTLWVNKTVALVRRPDGSPDYFIVVIEDISERKAAEAAVLALNAELEKRVEARTAELQAANTELESFVYAVSHDLRAPLRAMNGFSAILLREHGERLNSDARGHLDQIRQGALRMGELIEGLLVLSRSTRGDLRHDPVDLSALARRILTEFTRLEPERKVRWEVEDGLRALGDGRMLEVLLTNLLSNAWKYTGKNADGLIRFHCETQEDGPYFCVEDNGAGFDMSFAGRLFQPFHRLHRQDQFPGLGIGLATVRRIVERHGGRIGVRSEEGKGAAFYFSLPLVAMENRNP